MSDISACARTTESIVFNVIYPCIVSETIETCGCDRKTESKIHLDSIIIDAVLYSRFI